MKRFERMSRGCRLTAAMAMAASITGAVAQDAMLSLPATVVTGLGVDEVPTAGATELSVEDLDLYQVDSLQGLSGLAPNLHFSSSDSRGYGDVVTMRGQGNTLFFSPASVALYVDDVPYADAFSYPSELLGVSGIAIHRGPQGPGFGRNGAAGLIDITTPRPTAEQRWRLSADYGSYDAYGITLGSSGPLGGDLSHTLQVYYNERDGYVNNTFLGRHTDDREAMGVLANLFWNPCDDVEWRLRVAAEQMNDGSQRLTSLFSPDRYTVESDLAGETSIERYQVSLHGRRDFEWGTLKSITSYQDWELDPSTVDLDFTDVQDRFSRIQQEQTYLTQELRFESPEGASPLAWRAGMFASHKETDGDTTRGLAGPFVTERTLFDMDETTVAGYGRVSYRVNEVLGLEAGARLEYVESSMKRGLTRSYPGPPPGNTFDLDTDGVYFSPTGGINYAVADGVKVFARTGLGIKPRGFTAFSDNMLQASYGDERSWSNEVGVSVDSPDHGLSFGLRGFWNDISDYQLNKPAAGTDFIIVNADEVTSRGVEAEVRWRPMERLQVQATMGFQDTEFDKYSFGGTNYAGNTVPFVPEFTAATGFRYDFGNGFFVGSSVRAAGKTFYDDANTAAVTQDAYVIWDAQAGYQADGWSVTVYGRNLLDEDYYTFVNPLVYAGSPGDPQLFGVRLTAEF